MAQVFSNNLSTVLAAPITALDTTIPITTGTGNNFPNVTGGDFFLVTLIGLTELEETSWEILKVTAVTADSFTVQRAQESTTAVIWPAGTRIECRHTAGTNARFESNIAAAEANANSYTDTAEADANTYTDTAIANLVDSSPAALDTLNELAAALGDDPNFATTVNNEISKKVYGDGTDNSGTQIETTGSDFIASDSTNSGATHYIYRLHSAGKLYLGTDDDQVSFRSATVEFNGGNSFSSADVGNWNTAYGWGNHASAGYAAGGHTHTSFGTLAIGVINQNSGGQQLILNAGEASSFQTGLADEYIYLNAENGIMVNSSPDNWASLWAGRDTAILKGDSLSLNGSLVTPASISNWNSAHSWGDHGVEGYLVKGSTVDPIVVGGSTKFESNGTIGATYGATKSGLEVRGDENNDAFMAFHVSNDYAVYFGMSAASNRLEYGGWSLGTTRYQLWSSQDFALSSVTNGNTAYGWGDHAAEGYLTYPYVKWWRSGASSTDRIKIRLPWNTNAGKMLQFTVQSYGSYEQETYIVSGYLYGSQNQWYLPKYTHVGSITPDIIFGRDSDGRAYISLRGNNYHGVAISYPNITYTGSDGNATNTSWEIARDNNVPNQIAASESCTLNPSSFSEWNTAYAWGDHATAGYLTSLSGAVLTTNNSSLNTDTRNTRGPTRLYRRDSNTDYSVQTAWTGTYWQLEGYVGDTYHAPVRVEKAEIADTATLCSQIPVATGNYGTIKVNDDRSVTWAGYAIRDDWVLMSDGATHCGIYNDTDNEWMTRWYRNAQTELYYDGAAKFVTTSGGVSVTGQLAISSQYAYTAPNYGHGIFGVYSATRYQHVWSMGQSYKTSSDGTSYGNMYGLTWTHTNVGTATNQSISGLSHQLQLRENGTLNCAFGRGIWTSYNITAYSDRAVKTNLEVIPDALAKLHQINGYTYDRTDYEADPDTGEMPETRQAGVVAQEVEKILPEVVSGEEGNKAVAYGNMVALLVEALKEADNKIQALEIRLQGIEGY